MNYQKKFLDFLLSREPNTVYHFNFVSFFSVFLRVQSLRTKSCCFIQQTKDYKDLHIRLYCSINFNCTGATRERQIDCQKPKIQIIQRCIISKRFKLNNKSIFYIQLNWKFIWIISSWKSFSHRLIFICNWLTRSFSKKK